MDQRRVILVSRRVRRLAHRIVRSHQHDRMAHAGPHHTPTYNDARFRLLCQNQVLMPYQLREQNISTIALNADELHFDAWMERLHIQTRRMQCEQCGHHPAARTSDDILDHYPALKIAQCGHTICVYCLRVKYGTVASTIRCNVCSSILLTNSDSGYLDRTEQHFQ